MDIDICISRLHRAEEKVRLLEQMIENQTRDLYLASEELTNLYKAIPSAVFVLDETGCVLRANRSATTLIASEASPVESDNIAMYIPDFAGLIAGDLTTTKESDLITLKGESIPVLLSIARVIVKESTRFIVVAVDLRERLALEMELRQAQKLESLGQLSAGIAHEINTPMQFISDNMHFLQEVFADLMGLVEKTNTLISEHGGDLSEQFNMLMDDADIDYVKERGPKSFGRTLAGIERVSGIVSAMRAFSHSGTQHALFDLNKAVENTLMVSQSEFKYVAGIEKDLGDIPFVNGCVGDINQLLLNLVVNASHAIESSIANGRYEKGTIVVKTGVNKEGVWVSIGDNGAGIPENIKHKIYDPFFTTKEVGKGTGQGLSLAYKTASQHNGKLSFESEVGVGTVFTLVLPCNNQQGDTL